MVCITLYITNNIYRYPFTLLFALFHAHQIDGIAMRALVDVDTGIIENYWGCILRK
jgi:hypothetical protein